MILATTYLKPNITIESELVDLNKFYIYNYQGTHYRCFTSLIDLQAFIKRGCEACVFECGTENELVSYLYNLA